MKGRIMRRCSVLLLGLAMSGAAAAAVEGNATLTTDYVWRGSSQSDGDPAAQAGVKLVSERGWYASVWGSGVSFQPDNGARSEFDVVAGWSGALGQDWALDVNLTRYLYPSSNVDLNWTELNSTLTWKERYWVSVGASDDALASGRNQSRVLRELQAQRARNDELITELQHENHRSEAARNAATEGQHVMQRAAEAALAETQLFFTELLRRDLPVRKQKALAHTAAE